MLHTKFRENPPAGSGDGHGDHLGHVTTIMSSDLHFLEPESFQSYKI